jgi:hypothetical protein
MLGVGKKGECWLLVAAISQANFLAFRDFLFSPVSLNIS